MQLGLLVLAIWLAGQIVTQAMADHYALTHPAAAVLWRGDSANALTRLAEQRLMARDPAHAAQLARRALEKSPLQVRALSTLGAAWDQAGQAERADQLMTLAGSRSWRDGLAQTWLFGRRTLQGRYSEALDNADAILRRTANPQLFIILGAFASDSRTAGLLAERLRGAPSWRASFLTFLGADARPDSEAGAYAMLHALAQGPTPPTQAELGPYLHRLIREKKFQQADVALRELSRSAPAPGEYVHNGGFDPGHEAPPFDWRITASAGSSLIMSGAPGQAQGTALRVSYDGVSPSPFLRQMLAPPAGDYVLSGQILQETEGGADRFSWAVLCDDDSRILGRAAVRGARQGLWTGFQAPISLPADSCAQAWLQLIPDPGEQRSDIVVWYRGLSLRRR